MTVVTNLEVTNNIELPRPVRTRVMLTSPLETFSVGNTIIVSRGLIDVLPDETSLAMVLSHELAHIVLGHNLGSRYAFNDRMLFSDESTYQNLGFRHVPEEETAADKKAIDLLKNSPYAQKLDTAGLFLRELAERGPALSALLTPHLGNSLTDPQRRCRTDGGADDFGPSPRSKQAGPDSGATAGRTGQAECLGQPRGADQDRPRGHHLSPRQNAV